MTDHNFIDHDKWLVDYPEIWWQYASQDCHACGGSGEEPSTLRMCKCVDCAEAEEDGWRI